MSIDLSNIVYPDFITGLKGKDGWFKGGYDFASYAPTLTRFFLNKQMMRINLSTLNWTTPETGYSYTDWTTIFTFMNGYKLQIMLEERFGSPSIAAIFRSRWVDKNDNPIGNDQSGVTGFTTTVSSGTNYNTNWGNLFQSSFVMDIVLSTIYYPNVDPIPGTNNNGLNFIAYIGNTDYGYKWSEGSVPQPVAGRVGNWFTIGVWSDLELFDEYTHSHGDPFGGDQFSDDDTPDLPAGGDDNSTTGGGDGTYDPTSDPVDFPTLPSGGALTSGMIKGFLMNPGNLIGLQQKLWDMSFFDIATQFQKLVNQPLDCLISLHCLPLLPTTGNNEAIKLGSFDTEISAARITAQYMEIDAGSITVDEFWGSALDYAPYTQVEIFVPFVGFRNLQIEDVQKITLSLKYHVDILTGDCVAYLKCGQSVLYSWTGNCLSHVPCSAQSSDLLAKNISAVGSFGLGLATGNPAAAAAGAMTGAVNTATAKNHVQRSGDVAGSPGLMSEFTPYLVFHRPRQSLAKNYNHFKGYTTNITYKLSTLQGYTEVEHIHLTGINKATDAELQEIERLLKEGVII